MPLSAIPNQQLTSGQRPLLFGFPRDLISGTSRKCRMHAIRNWHSTTLTAPRQRLIHTNPRAAACAISKAQDYHPNVWSNSSSGIGSASIPASCNTQSCPASAARFAAWSNSSSDELINDNTAQRRVDPSIKSVNKISALADKARILSKSEFQWLTVYDFLRLATMYRKK